MSLEPPFLDPEYSEIKFWGVISAWGEGSNQWGPYKFLITRALVKHAALGDSEKTVKIKVGQQSEGNLYLLGFTHLSETVDRTLEFTRVSAKIEGQERMWFEVTSAKAATRPVPLPKESEKKAKK